MPDPQPTTAAKRLAEVAMNVVPFITKPAPTLDEWVKDKRRKTHMVALALDDAGVGKAVEHLSALARLAYAEGEPDSNVWVRKTRLALAALTGEGDAT